MFKDVITSYYIRIILSEDFQGKIAYFTSSLGHPRASPLRKGSSASWDHPLMKCTVVCFGGNTEVGSICLIHLLLSEQKQDQ